MGEIKFPNKRTFWKITSSDGTTIVQEGFTDGNQVTSTMLPIINQSISADDVYTALPSSGMLYEGEIYSYNGGMVRVLQDHERTIYNPDETPALFSVFRASSTGMTWIANEEVIIGDERVYSGNTYKCIQAHTTQTGWEPNNTPALWSLLSSGSEWMSGVSYSVDDIVTYSDNTYKCIQAHTSQVGWEPPNVPALWELL